LLKQTLYVQDKNLPLGTGRPFWPRHKGDWGDESGDEGEADDDGDASPLPVGEAEEVPGGQSSSEEEGTDLPALLGQLSCTAAAAGATASRPPPGDVWKLLTEDLPSTILTRRAPTGKSLVSVEDNEESVEDDEEEETVLYLPAAAAAAPADEEERAVPQQDGQVEPAASQPASQPAGQPVSQPVSPPAVVGQTAAAWLGDAAVGPAVELPVAGLVEAISGAVAPLAKKMPAKPDAAGLPPF
jgi:hypothetical protein